jgi:hypothetical protein
LGSLLKAKKNPLHIRRGWYHKSAASLLPLEGNKKGNIPSLAIIKGRPKGEHKLPGLLRGRNKQMCTNVHTCWTSQLEKFAPSPKIKRIGDAPPGDPHRELISNDFIALSLFIRNHLHFFVN